MRAPTCLYIAMPMDGGCAKIGIAADVFKRLAQLQTANPSRLDMYFAARFPDRQIARAIERRMHQLLEDCALLGEWFSCHLDDAHYAFELAMCEQMEVRGIESDADLDLFFKPLIQKAPPNG